MVSSFLLAATLGLVFVLHRIIGALRILRSVDYLPGIWTVFSLRSILYHLLPPIPWIKLNRNHVFEEGHKIFENLGWDAYSELTFWPDLAHTIRVADVEAIKNIVNKRFPKPTELFESTDIYGKHIISTDGDMWKKYRRISSPSFSEKNNQLVWEETLRIVDDLIENVWDNQDAVVGHAVDVTLPLALLVIGAAGFGQKVTWEDDNSLKPGHHQLTFREALHTTTQNLLLNVALPWWIKAIPHPRLKRIRQATSELGDYMREMIKDRQSSEVQDKHDLLSSLIQANKETELTALTDEELMGNLFIFLVAGHETTGNTLSFTFALLALYPDIQEKLFNHIKEIIPDERRPSYGDIPNLTYVMAVYNETLRLFAPATSVFKMAPEDTSMVVGNSFNNEKKWIPIPRGTRISIHIPGIHKNPRYWEKPDDFIPERFLGNYDKDALMAFSIGPRACLGRKFNETEGVAALTSIISRYKIEIQDEPQFKHETFEECKSRILATDFAFLLSPKCLPLKFKRR